MIITYILIFLLVLNIYLFRKLIFKWNVFSVFFISTLIFSTVGVLVFPFIKQYVIHTFWTFDFSSITRQVIIKTQLIAVFSVLLILYSYSFMMKIVYGKIKVINHINITGKLKDNISRSNYFFILFCIGFFLLVYLFLKRKVLYTGFFEGLIYRDPSALLVSRKEITSSYLYVIITYNLLPFITLISLYLAISKNSLFNKFVLYILVITSSVLILLLFQKRPLILFLLCIILSTFIFKRNLKKTKNKKLKSNKSNRKRFVIYGVLLFSLLMLLYYTSTNYQFNNIFQGVSKLTEVALTRVFGRLSIPSFFYVSYFPEVNSHYGIRNIGTLSKVFRYEVFLDTQELFKHFSKREKQGTLAINSIMDFYGAFGYYGLFIGNIILGFFIGALDVLLNKLEKNAVNMVFTIFCFVFAYYLSQASFARSLLGYGFFFFVLTWFFLQKGFKIKFR